MAFEVGVITVPSEVEVVTGPMAIYVEFLTLCVSVADFQTLKSSFLIERLYALFLTWC